MAFNPFHWFRKHQKVFFAGLIILCMLVFIGQAGYGADIFQTILRWLGAERAQGPPVTTLYGKRVSEGEMQSLARRRKLANDFLFETVWRLHTKAIDTLLNEKVKNDTPDNPLAGVRSIVDRAKQQSGISLLIKLRYQSQRPEDILMGIEADLKLIENIAQRDNVRNDPERLEILQEVATVFGFQAWLTQRPQVLADYSGNLFGGRRSLPADFVFGGSARPDDLLDFLVWQHQADRLGIALTDADLAKEINREAAGQEVFDDKTKSLEKDKAILAYVKGFESRGPAMPREFVEALREEYRVVMAQALLAGSEPGIRAYRSLLGAAGTPAFGTPDEFLHYYRDQRTTLRVKLLTVPVSAFLDKVTGKPSDRELRNRYERYREQEPSPFSREPGFKESRRIAVEYATASADDPFYRDAARKQAQTWKRYGDPTTRAASSFGLLAGTPVTGPFAAAIRGLDLYQQEYEKYVKEQPSWIPDFEDRSFPPPYQFHYSSVIQPETIAATFGSLFAAVQGSNNVLSAPITLRTVTEFVEIRESLKVNLSLLLGLSSAPGMSWDARGSLFPQSRLTAIALAAPYLPHLLPAETLEPQLLASLENHIAEGALQENLTTLGNELAKLKSRDRSAIHAYIEKVAKEYHLTLHAMPEPLTQIVMNEELNRKVDLHLGPLQEAYLSQDPSKVENFVAVLFQTTGVYEPRQLHGMQSQHREFLFWRSEDRSARTREFATIKSEVEAAWKFEEARRLARKEAERLQAEINAAKGTPADAERLLREQKGLGEIFELDNIAQLTVPREVHAALRINYVPYRIPSDMVDRLRYPPADMVKSLLTLKREGDATYFADMPAKHYYVAVLLNRNVPTVKEFESLYKTPPRDDELYTRFNYSQTDAYRRDVMDQLRREAGKVDTAGRFVLAESYRKRAEGGHGEEE